MIRILPIALAVAVAGCATDDSLPLVFAQGLTVGISVGQSPTAPGSPEIVVGVKNANVAVVPTMIPLRDDDPAPPTPSQSHRVAAFTATEAEPAKPNEDALSTFGSFEADTELNSVKLGVFFATGIAAQKLADGFKCAMSQNGAPDCEPAA